MSPASSTRPYGACSYVRAIRRATAIALRRPEPLSPSTAKDTSSSAVTQACGGSDTSGGRPGRKSSRQRTRFHSHVHGLVSWSPGDLRGLGVVGHPASGGREADGPQGLALDGLYLETVEPRAAAIEPRGLVDVEAAVGDADQQVEVEVGPEGAL